MQAAPHYGDVVAEVGAFLARARARRCGGRASRAERIVLDPGIGFGKTVGAQPRAAARASASCWRWACRCSSGWSRKSTLGALDRPRRWRERLAGERAPRRWLRCSAARAIVRVHDVAATVDALKVWTRPPALRADNPRIARRQRRTATHEQNAISAPTASAARSARRRSRPTSCCGSAMRSAACCKASDERGPTVLIGKDTRISGYMIESALEAGFASAGVDVLLTGPLPTPGVAYLTRALRLDLGVVISASHNPFADNGIKFFSARGEKLPDAWEQRGRGGAGRSRRSGSTRRGLGKARRLDDARGRYIEFCKSTFGSELSLKGLKIVVDAAHGAAYHVAPDVFHELGAEVVTIGCSPDGTQHQRRLRRDGAGGAGRRRCDEHGADYGIALDGDADRLQLVDAAGRLYNGDELLYVMVADRLAQGQRGAGRRRHADDQHGGRAGAARRAASTSCAPRSATATCSRNWSRAAGSSAARARATCWRSTSTPPATASSARCRCCRRVRAQRPVAGELLDGVHAVPADADQRAAAPRQRLEARTPAWPQAQAEVSANWATPGRVLIRAVRHRAGGARDGRGARRRAGPALRRAPRRRLLRGLRSSSRAVRRRPCDGCHRTAIGVTAAVTCALPSSRSLHRRPTLHPVV